MTALGPAPDVPLDLVEWRVDGSPHNNRARFVPYLSAPVVARLLDEWVGPANWRDSYEPSPGGKAMFCHVEVRDPETGEWVRKTDLGVPSNFEAEKGLISDAFKRAATLKWGAGRNVYSLPTLWAPCRVDSRGNAWPNDATLPDILDQLRAQGIDAAGGRTSAGTPHDHPDTDGEAGEKPAATSAQRPKPKAAASGAKDDGPATDAQKRAIRRLAGDDAYDLDDISAAAAAALIKQLQAGKEKAA